MFNLCCEDPQVISYNHRHTPIPFPFGNNVEFFLKRLMLYMPNLDSAQSDKITELSDSKYDQLFFDYLLKKMGMNEERDVRWLSKNEEVSDEEWDFFYSNLCLNCQKIIIRKNDSETKICALLRCIRNCIAHGDYFVHDDILIGFNIYRKHKTAVVKINYKKLCESINSIINSNFEFENILDRIVAIAFESMGYNFIHNNSSKFLGDFQLEKENQKYIVEIKTIKHPNSLKLEHLSRIEKIYTTKEDNQKLVLIMFTSRVNKDAKEKLKEYPELILINSESFKELIRGKDILSNE